MGLTAHRPASRSAPTYRAAWKCPARQLGLRHRLAGTASARASASASTQAHSRRLGCRDAEASWTSRHLARPARLASTGTASRACSRAGPPAATALPRFFIDSSPAATPQSSTTRSATYGPSFSASLPAASTAAVSISPSISRRDPGPTGRLGYRHRLDHASSPLPARRAGDLTRRRPPAIDPSRYRSSSKSGGGSPSLKLGSEASTICRPCSLND